MKPKVIKVKNENNDFQRVEVIKRNREKRNKYQEFFVEGVKPINFVLEYNWKIRSFLYTIERPLSDWGKEILENSTAESHLELPLTVMEKRSAIEEETSELIAEVY